MGNPGGTTVHSAGAADRREIAAILADAFGGDPVLNWLSAKKGYAERLFGSLLPPFLPHGRLYVAEQGKGAIVCLPPGAEMGAPPGLAWRMAWRYGPASAARLLRLLAAMERNHPGRAHLYVFAVGVRPAFQGAGVGSALLGHVLEQCDRDGVPAYLENSNPRNLPWYRGHGFQKAPVSRCRGKI